MIHDVPAIVLSCSGVALISCWGSVAASSIARPGDNLRVWPPPLVYAGAAVQYFFIIMKYQTYGQSWSRVLDHILWSLTFIVVIDSLKTLLCPLFKDVCFRIFSGCGSWFRYCVNVKVLFCFPLLQEYLYLYLLVRMHNFFLCQCLWFSFLSFLYSRDKFCLSWLRKLRTFKLFH